jgi:ribonuclease P protein component
MDKQPSKNSSKFLRKELDTFFSGATTRKKNQAFTFLTAPTDKTFGRILVIASRKYGNAPARNLLKRRCKSIFLQEKLYLKQIDCVIIARPEGKTYDFAKLKNILLEIFAQI